VDDPTPGLDRRRAGLDRHRAGLDRRGFLTLTGWAGAAVALRGVAGLPAAAASAPATGAAFFSPDEREILTLVVERMVESGEPEAPAVRSTAAIDVIDGLCGRLDPALTGPLPMLLRAVEWGPWIFELRFSRFSGLDAAGRDDSLRGWMTSRIGLRRLGFAALRNLAFLGYYSQEETWPLIGYRGPLLGTGAAS
jgi:hypothetical protein